MARYYRKKYTGKYLGGRYDAELRRVTIKVLEKDITSMENLLKDELQKKEKYELALKKYNEYIEIHEVRNYMNQIQMLYEKGREIRSDKSNYKRGLFSFFNKKPELLRVS